MADYLAFLVAFLGVSALASASFFLDFFGAAAAGLGAAVLGASAFAGAFVFPVAAFFGAGASAVTVEAGLASATGAALAFVFFVASGFGADAASEVLAGVFVFFGVALAGAFSTSAALAVSLGGVAFWPWPFWPSVLRQLQPWLLFLVVLFLAGASGAGLLAAALRLVAMENLLMLGC